MFRHVLILLASLAMIAPVAVSEASDEASPYLTRCQGGETYSATTYAIDDDSRITTDSQGWYYISYHPGAPGIYEETNRWPGLQVTQRTCSEYHAQTGEYHRTYIVWEPDEAIVGGYGFII